MAAEHEDVSQIMINKKDIFSNLVNMRSLWNPKSTNFVKVICGKDGGGGLLLLFCLNRQNRKKVAIVTIPSPISKQLLFDQACKYESNIYCC